MKLTFTGRIAVLLVIYYVSMDAAVRTWHYIENPYLKLLWALGSGYFLTWFAIRHVRQIVVIEFRRMLAEFIRKRPNMGPPRHINDWEIWNGPHGTHTSRREERGVEDDDPRG
jgi:hypothetical protein